MIDSLLNPSETISLKMSLIIDSFVSFYGEEYKTLIEEKFSNVKIIPYSTFGEYKNLISTLLRKELKERVYDFFRENNIEATDENFVKYIGDGKIVYQVPIDISRTNIKTFYQGDQNELESYRVRNYVDWLHQYVSSDITIENYRENLKSPEVNRIINQIRNMRDSFASFEDSLNEIDQKYQRYQEYIDKSTSYINNLKDNYYEKYIEKIESLVPDKGVTKENSCPIFCKYNSFSIPGLIEAFTSDSNELLNNNNCQWKTSSIKDDRVAFFKNNGIDLGDNYDDYLNNEVVRQLLTNITILADKVQTIRSKIVIEFEQKSEELEPFQQSRKEIEQLKLENNEDVYTSKSVCSKTTCVVPNRINNKLYSLLILNCSMYSIEDMDQNFIHELNHIFELRIIDDEHYLCGWDFINMRDNDDERRQYELLNEIVNDLIAQKITKVMHDNGGCVFSSKDGYKVNSTSYQYSKFIVFDIFKNFFGSIIKSRINGDMNIIYDEVGKENFIALNNLMHRFNDSFTQIDYIKCITSIKEGKENDLTKEFIDIKIEASKIYQNMISYNESKKNNNVK